MNDRLRIASEQLASMQHMDRDDRVRAALEEADALLAAAGECDASGLQYSVEERIIVLDSSIPPELRAQIVRLISSERNDARAWRNRAAELQAKLDEAARLARETAGEAMEAVRADTPVVVIPEGDWRRLVELTSGVFPSHRCADDDCEACRDDDELKAIIERTEAANG